MEDDMIRQFAESLFELFTTSGCPVCDQQEIDANGGAAGKPSEECPDDCCFARAHKLIAYGYKTGLL